MEYIIKFLKGNEKNISRECFFWNIIAGGVNAAEAVVLMLIITRINGVEAAGVLSIAFAVGNLLMTVGKYGVRNFQVTDVVGAYKFSDYYTLRIITALVMMFLSIFYVFVKMGTSEYSLDKSFIILGICLIYVIESFEDVFLGFYQKEGRLDIASKVFIIRWMMIMFSFIMVSILWHNLLFAVYSSVIISFVSEIILLNAANKIFSSLIVKVNLRKLFVLLKQCFALFLSSFLVYYVTNAPKYAIDQYLTEDIQAYYGYISMPVFVVELLNCFLYQPQMVDLANSWNSGLLKLYNKKMHRQIGAIVLLTIICVLGAYLFGIPILSVIYGVDLSAYKLELIVLMVSGGALAFVGYTSVLLTIMRKQKILLANMLFVSIMSVLGMGKVVKWYGMLGAVKYYLLLMFMLSIFNYCYIMVVEYKIKNGKSGGKK